MNNFYNNVVKSFEIFKADGIPKSEALDCLEFDSDEYPDMDVLKQVLDEVYGKGG